MKELGVIMLCLFFNALLVGTEMAFVLVNKPTLRRLAREGTAGAAALLRLRERPERTLSVIQVGITLGLSLAGVVGGAGAEEVLSPMIKEWLGVSENIADTMAITMVVLPLMYGTVVIGELVPKSLALKNPLKLALIAAPALTLFERMLSPVVNALEWSTKRFLTVLRFVTRSLEESSLSDGAESTVELGLLSTQHRQYVMNLVDLERKRINDIYLPWDKVSQVNVAMTAQEVETIVISSGHTRLPVLRGDRVVGILNTKEFAALRASGREDWESLVRPVVELPVETPLLAGLRLLQERRMHMAIVYASNERRGVVTLEDILEEVVGEIYDEDDDGMLRRILGAVPIAGSGRSQRIP
ncbi:MAG TPA: hemolysin family protein [Nitrospiraceae bacterium]|jgi:putative hemolysin